MQYVAMGTVHGDVLGCPWSNSRHFTDFHRSSEPLEPLGFVGPFGLTGAGSWDLLVNVCKCVSTETSTLTASGSTLQQLSIGIGRRAFTQVWSKVERC